MAIGLIGLKWLMIEIFLFRDKVVINVKKKWCGFRKFVFNYLNLQYKNNRNSKLSMSKAELNEMDNSPQKMAIESGKSAKWTVLGLMGLALGVLAWVVLYRNQWCGISVALVGAVTSFFGVKGRFRNLAICGIVVNVTLLLVVGIMCAVFYYVFESIK